MIAGLTAFLLAGCGDAHRRNDGSGSVTLRVKQLFVPGQMLYAEGSDSFVRVEREGRKAIERQLVSPTKIPRARIRLEPGAFRLVSFQRPCDGNCGTLDGPTDQCSGSFKGAAGDVIDLTVRFTPGEGCKISED